MRGSEIAVSFKLEFKKAGRFSNGDQNPLCGGSERRFRSPRCQGCAFRILTGIQINDRKKKGKENLLLLFS